MKHYEELWIDAEESIKQYYSEPLNIIIGKIKSQLDNLILITDQNEQIESIGKILLDLCYISDHLNINVYAALNNQLEDLKLKIPIK